MFLGVALCLAVSLRGVTAACKTTALTEMEQAVLDRHNTLRGLHEDTLPLCYGVTGSDITFSSQAYAEELSGFKTMTMTHSDSSKYNPGGARYGENLAAGMGSGVSFTEKASYISSTQSWYDEIQFWDYSTNAKKDTALPTDMVGHFTQVVWKSSVQLNCGFAPFTSSTGTQEGYHVVCQYYPAGNFINQYAANVKPLISNTTPPKCSKPSVANSATITPDMEISIGETYTVTCSAGFELSGSNPTCTVDGSSAAKLSALPYCFPLVSCSKPTVNDATSVLPDRSITDGESYTVTCRAGFKLVGSQPKCTVSDNEPFLSAIPTCQVITTCSLPTIANAASVLPATDITEGQRYTVQCLQGYSLDGTQPSCIKMNTGGVALDTTPKCSSAATVILATTYLWFYLLVKLIW